VQAYIAAACGVEINRAEVMHLHKEFRNPDVGDLFARTDVTRHEHDRVRKDLLNYCERDTWAMVKLLEKLASAR